MDLKAKEMLVSCSLTGVGRKDAIPSPMNLTPAATWERRERGRRYRWGGEREVVANEEVSCTPSISFILIYFNHTSFFYCTCIMHTSAGQPPNEALLEAVLFSRSSTSPLTCRSRMQPANDTRELEGELERFRTSQLALL